MTSLAGTLQLLRGMHVLRSMTYGMLGACLWLVLVLVARSGPVHIVVGPSLAVSAPPVSPAVNTVSILDIAQSPRGWGVQDLVDMVPLAPGERISAIDDRPVGPAVGCSPSSDDGDMVALRSGGYIAGLERHVPSRGYVDFTIASAAATRRVLVVVH